MKQVSNAIRIRRNKIRANKILAGLSIETYSNLTLLTISIHHPVVIINLLVNRSKRVQLAKRIFTCHSINPNSRYNVYQYLFNKYFHTFYIDDTVKMLKICTHALIVQTLRSCAHICCTRLCRYICC